MKKFFLILIAFSAITINSAKAQAVWGARVGLSIPTVSSSFTVKGSGQETYKNSVDGKFGLELGPVLYYSFNSNFYINPSLMFSIKTFDFGDNESLSMYYADIPVYAGYNFSLGSVSLYAQAGPFVGFKLGENAPKIDGEKTEDSGFKSINAGLGAIVGVSLKRFKIELGYQQGLMNLEKEAETEFYSVKTTMSSLFIGINYVF
ncbi:MAG: PorT family protein [Prevotellaceae bacterium]|jgi:hypothetical protein|nr:PorT family protein [Prevotellaceae bacterium]